MVPTIHRSSFIFKTKTNATIVNSFYQILAKMNQNLRKITKIEQNNGS